MGSLRWFKDGSRREKCCQVAEIIISKHQERMLFLLMPISGHKFIFYSHISTCFIYYTHSYIHLLHVTLREFLICYIKALCNQPAHCLIYAAFDPHVSGNKRKALTGYLCDVIFMACCPFTQTPRLLKNTKHFNTWIHNITCFHCTIY